jgi:hypothetical protein
MASACSIIVFIVCILCERVVDVIVEELCCKSETSLSRLCWSSVVFYIVPLAFLPIIVLTGVVESGIGIGWTLGGPARLWGLLRAVKMGG